MEFDVSGPVRAFSSLAVLVVVAGVIAIATGLAAGAMPRRRKKALVNLVFALVMLVGALIILV